MTKKRIKAPATGHVPATRDECASQIRRIGDLQREHARLQADLNDRVAALTDEAAPRLAELCERIKALSIGAQSWCEANRSVLTDGDKVKFHDFVTGVVRWRTGNASVRVTGEEAVLKTLRMLGLNEFIRVSEEVNKEAVLANYSAAPRITSAQINGEADPDTQAALLRTLQAHEMLQGLSGLKVASGREAFSIEPVELGEVAA